MNNQPLWMTVGEKNWASKDDVRSLAALGTEVGRKAEKGMIDENFLASAMWCGVSAGMQQHRLGADGAQNKSNQSWHQLLFLPPSYRRFEVFVTSKENKTAHGENKNLMTDRFGGLTIDQFVDDSSAMGIRKSSMPYGVSSG